MVRARLTSRQPLPNYSSGHLEGWATLTDSKNYLFMLSGYAITLHMLKAKLPLRVAVLLHVQTARITFMLSGYAYERVCYKYERRELILHVVRVRGTIPLYVRTLRICFLLSGYTSQLLYTAKSLLRVVRVHGTITLHGENCFFVLSQYAVPLHVRTASELNTSSWRPGTSSSGREPQ